jgi:hypothetical protein
MYRYEVTTVVRDAINGVVGRPLFYEDASKWYINSPEHLSSFQFYDAGTDTVKSETLDQICQALYSSDFSANSTQEDYVQELISSEGAPVYAPTFEDDLGLSANFAGSLYSCTAGQTNIFDKLVTTKIKIRGGWYEVFQDPTAPVTVAGDYLEFSVVDKDDALGLFAMYGLTVGVDVLELGKFVKDYINPYSSTRQEFVQAGASELLAGLYERTTVVSTGVTNFDIKVNTFGHYDL